jgi:predicted RecB family nuclease
VGVPPTQRRLSPSRLNDFLGCEYRTYLDLLADRGEIDREDYKPPDAQLLLERGLRHEEQFLQTLRDEGRDVLSLSDKERPSVRAEQTEDAMRAGREVIHQACFLHDGWIGYADFLIRIEMPSQLGDWSYEVHDAKLGRSAKPTYIFQLLFYNEQVARIQGRRPARMHLVLGDGERPPFAPEDFDAYAAKVTEYFLARRAELEDGATPVYPYKVSDCDFCPWWKHCVDKRREDDHLSLVATLDRSQGLKLEATGIHSVTDVARINPDTRIPRLAPTTLDGLRQQAALQVRSRDLETPEYELLEPEHDRGLARLPLPSEGDVFFDFEGDPWWGDEGLEYLFGTVYERNGKWRYWPLWAETRAEEKLRFEEWMDWITERLEQHPDLHIFHFNAYEPVAIKKLMARHATREYEVDELLRRSVFVDLYGVVRQALRAGVESYGLKALERVFGFERRAPLREAVGSLRGWQAYLETGDREELDAIAAYNEDDCFSTRALRDWLMDRRLEAEHQFDVSIDALEPTPAKPLSDKAIAYQAALERARAALTHDLPDDESDDTEEQRARRILFDLLGYHRREAKPAWWEYYRRVEMTPEDLRDYDSEAIGDLKPVPGVRVQEVKQSYLFTLEFPQQEYKLGDGAALDDSERGVTIVSLDESTRRVEVKRGKKQGTEPPRALIPGSPYATDAQVEALFRLADRVATKGLAPTSVLDSSTDLLLRRVPRFLPGTPALRDGHVDIAVLRAQVVGLDHSALFVQGPPGSGKTWAGARVAVDLMRRGKRVGVVATSHKAIINLLEEIDCCADDESADFRGWKKAADEAENNYASDRIACGGNPPKDIALDLVAGTPWLWAREDVKKFDVDVLLIDEAGQMSLADALAVAQGAKSVVLLGDPQQLAHVSQGTHPHGSGVSVLEHLLAGRDTVPADRGVFLDRTYRMHPGVCEFVSSTMYDGRLHSVEGCERQRIESPGLAGAGLRRIAVAHEDNRQRSPEEAEAIRGQVAALLDGGRWTDRHGDEHKLTLDDILVVAPYNAQVRTLKSVLPAGARVGTVDKFQGQEAPVVFFSMTTSMGEHIPRGMDFLFSRNRLNVAVSRAQAMAIVVCSPALFWSRCSTIEQMKLVNMLCRFSDSASMVSEHRAHVAVGCETGTDGL